MEKRYSKPHLHSDWIEPQARDIVSKLQTAGFSSYLVGGCVRDLLAGIHPKDYDIATDAQPDDIRKIIRGSYIIGRRFRLVLVKRGENQYEVATFRRNALAEDLEAEDAPQGDNFFGTPEEDAKRRDFTVNALFYDPVKNDLIDFIDGVSDIENGFIKMIGDPDERLIEDPIRILRAVRLSQKLNFSIDPDLRRSILKNAPSIGTSVLPRKREEYLKLLRLEDSFLAFQEMYDLGLLPYTLPSLIPFFENPEKTETLKFNLRRSREIGPDAKSTLHLTLPLVLSFFESSHQESASEFFNAEFERFLKEELGLFKNEIFALFDVFDLFRPLKQIDYFLRKGTRRQMAFLERENLHLSIQTAGKIFQISPKELLFWKKHLTL